MTRRKAQFLLLLSVATVGCGGGTQEQTPARPPTRQVDTTSPLWTPDPKAPTVLDFALTKVQIVSARHVFPKDPKQFEKQISQRDVNAFIEKLRQLAVQSFGSSATSLRVTVMVDCRVSGHKATVMADGAPALTKTFTDSLTSIDSLPTKEGEVMFAVELSVLPW